MANEFHLEDPGQIGNTLYVILWNEAGQAWNGAAFATWTGVHANFDIAAADSGGVGYFLASMPAVAAGNYRWKWFVGGVELASGSGYSNGTAFGAVASVVGAVGSVTGTVGGIAGTITTIDALVTKLRKYFQLTLRKDAAIGTDNASELTEINASGGSGAGAYAQTTDSQEATKDTIGVPVTTTLSADLALTLAKTHFDATIAAAPTLAAELAAYGITSTVVSYLDAPISGAGGGPDLTATGEANYQTFFNNTGVVASDTIASLTTPKLITVEVGN